MTSNPALAAESAQSLGTEEVTRLNFESAARLGFVSVVIPVYDDPAGLTETLRSLASQTLPKSEYEVIVANDGAEDSISEVCRSFDVAHVDILPRRGSYFARNRALEKARGEYIAFADSDVSVPTTWLEAGRRELEKSDYAGGPVVIDEAKIETPAHLHESLKGFPTEQFFYDQHFCVTANLFVKRSVLEKIGGFDERLHSGGDNEFGKRVYSSGAFEQRYSEELSVLHPPRGFDKLVGKKVRQHKGRILMNRLFPERYDYPRPGPMKLLTSMLVPPRLSSVKRVYSDRMGFSIIEMYLFAWKYKYRVNQSLWRLYYRSGSSEHD